MNPGLYIHIPFCKTRCTYCNFSFVINYPKALPARYTTALIREIECFNHPPISVIDSVYFGGGTPSNIPAERIGEIMEACRRSLPIAEQSEITLEINPDTIDAEKAQAYQRLGVNRASLGAQSFTDAELRSVGRSHRAEQISEAFRLLRQEGFDNISMDLMIGLPGQTGTSWTDSLDHVRALHPEHVSIYMLELDAETRLGKDFYRGKTRLPDDEFITEAYLDAIGRLSRDGYEHYEISNFAQPGKASRHNLKYWMDVPYYGFGASSHAYFGGVRYRNEPDLEPYIQRVEQTNCGVVESTILTPERHFQEAFYLRLRRREGVDMDAFRIAYGRDLAETHGPAIARLIDAGLLTFEGPRLKLTTRGLVLSNEVFEEFL